MRETVGVIGLGAMGLGIAQVFAQAGHPVQATDGVEAVRDSASGRLAAALAGRVASGKMTAGEVA
ncbi:MAG TPA: 3-hydroxyacyl-CoA dehydrogenase NAD-binding domain-containing protein, partial [Paracoccaceae bacterium]|nr:3-hydroxyacyl-CoA dehydrogenase NAD-binding domain-containing protein [Paracoccaceae bacterium]